MKKQETIRRSFLAVTVGISLISLFSCWQRQRPPAWLDYSRMGAFEISKMNIDEKLPHGSIGTYPEYSPEMSQVLENHMYQVTSHVDVVNRLGQQSRINYIVKMHATHSDDTNGTYFDLVSLEMKPQKS